MSLTGIAKQGIILYAAAYSLATIGIFAVLMRMKEKNLEQIRLGPFELLLAGMDVAVAHQRRIADAEAGGGLDLREIGLEQTGSPHLA